MNIVPRMDRAERRLLMRIVRKAGDFATAMRFYAVALLGRGMSSPRVAEILEQGVFVKVTGNGHLGYGQSRCAQDLVDKYLVDLKVPKGDVDCD